MIAEAKKIDDFDMKILRAMQIDATLSQRDLADKVGLSQTPAGDAFSGCMGLA